MSLWRSDKFLLTLSVDPKKYNYEKQITIQTLIYQIVDCFGVLIM